MAVSQSEISNVCIKDTKKGVSKGECRNVATLF